MIVSLMEFFYGQMAENFLGCIRKFEIFNQFHVDFFF